MQVAHLLARESKFAFVFSPDVVLSFSQHPEVFVQIIDASDLSFFDQSFAFFGTVP